ncbi:hypothetical protein D9M69_571180 [compost metagenome]
MQHLAVITFCQARHLQVITTQVGEGTVGSTPTQHRTGNHAVIAGLQLTDRQLAQVGPQAGTQQTRLLHHGAAQSDHALDPQLPGSEQLADGDDVLIIDRPDTLARTDRIEEVDMGTRQTGRMRAGKGLCLHLAQLLARQAAAIGLAQEDLGQIAQYLETVFEISGICADDHSRISRQRLGVHGCDENRAGHRINRRHLAERTSTQCGPETGPLQVFANLRATQTAQLR